MNSINFKFFNLEFHAPSEVQGRFDGQLSDGSYLGDIPAYDSFLAQKKYGNKPENKKAPKLMLCLKNILEKMVGVTRVEPVTPSMSTLQIIAFLKLLLDSILPSPPPQALIVIGLSLLCDPFGLPPWAICRAFHF